MGRNRSPSSESRASARDRRFCVYDKRRNSRCLQTFCDERQYNPPAAARGNPRRSSPIDARVLLLIIAAAAFASTLAGGLLALGLRDKLHLILGFSAGAVVGVAFFDLLPEAVNVGLGGPALIMSWTAAGFLAYLVLDRILLFHAGTAPRGGAGALVLCCHSLLDGVAIGLAFQASRDVGIVVAVAVLTHDFSDGINTMNIVLRSGGDRSRALRWLLADAVAP